MKQKRISLLVLVVGLLILGFLGLRFYGWAITPKEASMPEPNIEVQTKIVEGITFALRNAHYAENKDKVGYDEVMVGFEIKGFTLITDYNVTCQFYTNGKDISASPTNCGGLLNLGDKHFYLDSRESVRNKSLPDPLNLTVKITAKPTNSRLKNITASFDVSINKENKKKK